jgi:hypothetical protein
MDPNKYYITCKIYFLDLNIMSNLFEFYEYLKKKNLNL